VYGFRLLGTPGARTLLVDAPDDWPTLTVERIAGGHRPASERVSPREASVWLSGDGFAEVDRATLHARMHVPEGTTDDALIHPYLAPVALVSAWWLGRESFHGGAILADGGAWAFLGDKTAGKSTLLASFALAGVEVMSDDVLIVDAGDVLAGPRSVDLRGDAARQLGAGDPLGWVGMRERWRLRLAPVPVRLPLRGWITLGWGDEVSVEPLRGSERLTALLPHQGVRLGSPGPAGLVELSALPHWRVVRPRDWTALEPLRERLLAAIAG
jgi:hypothetical protein